MTRSLSPIPTFAPIVDTQGQITTFFRLLWQALIGGWAQVPTAATPIAKTGQSASIVTSTLLATPAAGLYRVSWYLRKTVADGVASSLTMTIGWTDSGVSLTKSGSALTTDSTTAEQDGAFTVYADAASDLTYAVAYASNTPGKMTYDVRVSVEQLVG